MALLLLCHIKYYEKTVIIWIFHKLIFQKDVDEMVLE